MPDDKLEKQLKACETRIAALEKRFSNLDAQLHITTEAVSAAKTFMNTYPEKARVASILLNKTLLDRLDKESNTRERREAEILEKAKESKVEAGKAAMEAAEAFLRKADFKKVAAEAAEVAAQRAIQKADFKKIAFEAATVAAKHAGSAPP